MEAVELSPQYWRTSCMVCDKTIFAATEHVVCNDCTETSALTDYIATLNAVISDLEAQTITQARTIRELTIRIREHEAADVIALEAMRVLRGEQ
jgi:hypothetical protein